jgi:hypothetical protein
MKRLYAGFCGLATSLLIASCGGGENANKQDSLPPTKAFALKRIALLSQFTEIDTFSVADGIARAEKEGKYGFIDSTGKEVVPCTNYNVQDFHDGLGLVQETEDGGLYFVDKTGKKVIDLAGYENAFSFQNGYATVAKSDGYGLIDKTGKETIPCKSSSGIFMISPGNYIADIGTEKTIVNGEGKATLPFKGFDEIYFDKVNSQYAYSKEGKWVIAAPDGAIKVNVDAAGLIHNNGMYFLSKTTEGKGTENAVMNGKGEMVIPYGKYYSINTSAPDGMICVGVKTGETPESDGVTVINQKIGYCDLTGKEVIPPQFEDVMFDFSEGLCVVQVKGQKGYIDKTGKLVIPAQYEKAGNFQHGYAKVTSALGDEHIDKTGKKVQ